MGQQNGVGWGLSGALDLTNINGPRLTGRVSTLRHTLTQTDESRHACTNEHFTFSDEYAFKLYHECVHVCARVSLPVVDCSMLAPGLYPWVEAAACGAYPGHPPHSHRPGLGKEWMGYLTDEPAGDF